jgi:hypothetical protein
MVIIEGRLGDSGTTLPWYTILKERIFVGEEILFAAYTSKVLLRGFQVTFAGTDRHLQELEIRLEESTSVDNPGYVNLEASLKLRDDEPGRESLAGFTLSGEELVSILVEYTLLVW